MSFAIIISEKGGAERRELFEKSEIYVGRVQGNDLMLPKGNVSKRHAKLMFRDGRFIVADLKSTNGTYVNGRRIGQATIVREGDKIYVGDFILRFEATPGTVLAAESSATAPGPREASAAELGQPPSVPVTSGTQGGPREGISHFPLENDPDDASGVSPRVVVPSPPKVPSGLSKGPGGTQAMNVVHPPTHGGPGPSTESSTAIHATAHAVVAGAQPHGTHPHGAMQGAPQPAAPRAAPPPLPGGSSSVPPAQPSPATPQPRPPTASPRDLVAHPISSPRPPRDASGQAAHRLALTTLVDRIYEMLDLDPLRESTSPSQSNLIARVEKAIREQAAQLRQDGEIPESVDVEGLCRDAQRELIGLGPLASLLDDEEVSVISIHRYDHVVARRGQVLVPIEPPFSSEESLRRAIARLCSGTGQPLAPGELIVERQLARGQLTAVLSPLAMHGHTAQIRKRRRVDGISEDLVRNGTVSRAMWTFLGQALGARLSALVLAPPGPGVGSLVSGLLGLAASDERVAVLQPSDGVLPLPSLAVPFVLDEQRGPQLVRAAGRLQIDRLVIGGFAGPVAAAALDVASERLLPLLATTPASSLQKGFARLAAELTTLRPGLSIDGAREWLASTFDIVVEMARLKDGRHRVLRIAELRALERGQIEIVDLFVFQVDRSSPGAEGSFAATGVIPRFVDDLRLRGVSFDTSVFSRLANPPFASARCCTATCAVSRGARQRRRRLSHPSRTQRKPMNEALKSGGAIMRAAPRKNGGGSM